jgi:hypothetical protein
MGKVDFISHKGKRMLYIDASGCKAVELAAVCDRAKQQIGKEPQASLLILTNVTGTEISKETSAIIKDLTTFNKPFVKASAVVGVEGLKKIIYNAVMTFSGRTIASKDTLDQAKDWLAAQ